MEEGIMPLNVKPIEASTTKWNENASRAAEEYASRAEAAADSWAKGAAGAAESYKSAVTATGIGDRFRRGVQKAGASKYARKIREVAKDRFGPGIAAAITDYRAGAEPYFQTLAGLSLDQRKPRGDPANYRRVEQVGKALNAKRLAMLGSGTSA